MLLLISLYFSPRKKKKLSEVEDFKLQMARCYKCFVFFSILAFAQGKLDAIWALFRRGYDQVSLMRPQPGDHVSNNY